MQSVMSHLCNLLVILFDLRPGIQHALTVNHAHSPTEQHAITSLTVHGLMSKLEWYLCQLHAILAACSYTPCRELLAG